MEKFFEKTITANGCGAYYFYYDFNNLELTGFNECCNRHDKCYSTCGENKNKCDTEFKKCLVTSCDIMSTEKSHLKHHKETCINISHFLDLFVNKFGCTAYLNAQRQACDCLIVS
jgi:secretory phospholipase A2